MTQETYTVMRKDGEVIASGCTLEEAAHEMLTRDGHSYRLSNSGEENPENYRLYVTRNGNNAQNYALWPDYDSDGKGDGEIWRKVVVNGGVCGTTAMTDSDYNAMVRQAEND